MSEPDPGRRGEGARAVDSVPRQGRGRSLCGPRPDYVRMAGGRAVTGRDCRAAEHRGAYHPARQAVEPRASAARVGAERSVGVPYYVHTTLVGLWLILWGRAPAFGEAQRPRRWPARL